jgi:hypothetical protein
MNFLKSLFFLSMLFSAFATFAVSQGQVAPLPQPPKAHHHYSLTVNAPIYSSQNEKINLSVQIPKNFKALISAAEAAKLKYLKFIPNNEESNNWSELLTLQILTDKRMSAVQYTLNLKQEFQKQFKNATLLQQFNKTEDKFLISTLAYVYENQGRREIVYMRYYSSSNHLSGLQFTRVVDAKADAKVILQEMIDYMDLISKVTMKDNKPKNLSV